MKRILLFLFILLSLSEVKASDTLTLRQIYNFNVGDTFDYREITILPNLQFFRIVYVRKVLTQINYSTGQDTLYFTFYLPIRGLIEIDSITNLDSSIIFNNPVTQDTFCHPPFSFDSTTYFGYKSDSLSTGCFENVSYYRYTNRLGRTYYYNGVFDGGSITFVVDSYTEELVYFSNDSISIGTPYYILAGINDLTNTPQIHLYPNPTTDQIRLSISDMNGSNYQLILTDILGQEVYSAPVTQSESIHGISRLSSGIYTWRVSGNNSIVKTGKVVKE